MVRKTATAQYALAAVHYLADSRINYARTAQDLGKILPLGNGRAAFGASILNASILTPFEDIAVWVK
jgi:hypothetical protein